MDWQRMVDVRAARGKSLAQALAEDEVVAKRGKPSLPRVKFLEGPGPEQYDDAKPRAA